MLPRQFDPTPAQPLGERRCDRFLPESRYYGDKFPRTMEEAFGPYAELSVEDEPARPARYDLGYVVAVAVALVLGFISWRLQQ